MSENSEYLSQAHEQFMIAYIEAEQLKEEAAIEAFLKAKALSGRYTSGIVVNLGSVCVLKA